MSEEPSLFVLWYDFTKWLLQKTEKLPRRVRFTFSSRMENLALDILEGIAAVRYSKEKEEMLQTVDLNIERLRVLARIGHDLGWVDHKMYEHASRVLVEAGRMVGGWRKHAGRHA